MKTKEYQTKEWKKKIQCHSWGKKKKEDFFGTKNVELLHYNIENEKKKKERWKKERKKKTKMQNYL